MKGLILVMAKSPTPLLRLEADLVRTQSKDWGSGHRASLQLWLRPSLVFACTSMFSLIPWGLARVNRGSAIPGTPSAPLCLCARLDCQCLILGVRSTSFIPHAPGCIPKA